MVKQRCLDGENVVIDSFCSGRSTKIQEKHALGSGIKKMKMTSFVTRKLQVLTINAE